MRKGPIEQYSVEATLKLAAREGCTGSIDVASSARGTVYLENGYVYFAELEGVPSPVDVGREGRPPKEVVRRYVESVLCVLFEVEDGWYEWNPHESHPDGVRWVFGWDGLQRSVQARLDEDRAFRRWSARPVTLEATTANLVRLTPDMWDLVRAMSAPMASHHLRDRLGWDAERLAEALAELENVHLIRSPDAVEEPTFPEPTAVPATPSAVVPAVGAPGDLRRWTGTPDLTLRPLVAATSVRSRQPATVGAATPGPATAPAPTPGAASGHAPADPQRPIVSAAPASPPAAPSSGGPTRKSALKRLISSLRQ